MSNTHSKPRRSILGIVASTLGAAAAPSGKPTLVANSDHVRFLPRANQGCKPDLFGPSEFCRRLRRKNRLRRLGIGADHR